MSNNYQPNRLIKPDKNKFKTVPKMFQIALYSNFSFFLLKTPPRTTDYRWPWSRYNWKPKCPWGRSLSGFRQCRSYYRLFNSPLFAPPSLICIYIFASMATTMLLSTYYRPAIDGECFFTRSASPAPRFSQTARSGFDLLISSETNGGPGLDYGVSWPAHDDIKVRACLFSRFLSYCV